MDGYELASKLVPSALDFLAKLAWPGVALYVLAKQKRAVGALFERLSELQLGSAKAKFNEKVAAVAAKAEVLETAPFETPQLDAMPAVSEPAAGSGVPSPHVGPTATPGAQFGGHGVANATGSATLTVGKVSTEELNERREKWISALFGNAVDDKLRASGLIITEWAKMEAFLRDTASSVKLVFADSDSSLKLIERLRRHHFITFETALILSDLARLRNEVAHAKFEPTKDAAESYAETCLKTQGRVAAEFIAWRTKMMQQSGSEQVEDGEAEA